MRIRWYGQSAFLISGNELKVFIDPFGDMGPWLASRGLEFSYPPIAGVTADLLLVTHEHRDHNAVEVDRRRACRAAVDRGHTRLSGRRGRRGRVRARRRGRHDARPEHDLLFHARRLADQSFRRLRPECAETRAARGDRRRGRPAAAGRRRADGRRRAGRSRSSARLQPRLVVPHHYRTEAVNFLDPPDAFLDALGAHVERLDGPELVVDQYLGMTGQPIVVLPDYPRGA